VRATARISRRPRRPVLNSVATRSNSTVSRKTPEEASPSAPPEASNRTRFRASFNGACQLPNAWKLRNTTPPATRPGARAAGTVGQVGAEGCEIHAVAARPRQTTRRGPDRAGAQGVPSPVERQAGRVAKPLDPRQAK
jgi:hypothetical protein